VDKQGLLTSDMTGYISGKDFDGLVNPSAMVGQ
jgi:hypothetical protein